MFWLKPQIKWQLCLKLHKLRVRDREPSSWVENDVVVGLLELNIEVPLGADVLELLRLEFLEIPLVNEEFYFALLKVQNHSHRAHC